MRRTLNLFVILFLTCFFCYGQMEQYDYKRELKGISQPWHEIELPDEVFGKTLQNLRDIRIYGITPNKDTIEAPYLLRVEAEKTSRNEIDFEMLNSSQNERGYFFTFEIPADEPVNQIKLDFEQKNFDWQITLEGSQNQNEWLTILQDYRILSIENELTDFQFTKLGFPNSKYRYFRLFINSKEKPDLTNASVAKYEVTNGSYKNYVIEEINTKENKQHKQTEIDVEMQQPIRASQIRIHVSNTFDYYRPIRIKYLSDSVKTEKGWKYNYTTLTSGTLNSMEENEFNFNPTTLKNLKIFINNQDNQALTINSIEVKGPVHKLAVRFTEPATYFLTYGYNKAMSPNYDIDRFADKIPNNLTEIRPGKEIAIEKENVSEIEPLFQNKNWLWAIMAIIILLLGWFSLKMIRNK